MFDAYHKWLGIAKEEQPPTHYRLLGINRNEEDPEVIEEAAIRQTAHLRAYQLGVHAAECRRLLNEIAHARTTLLNAVKRQEYDAWLAKTKKQDLTDKPRDAVPASLKTIRSTNGRTRRVMVGIAGATGLIGAMVLIALSIGDRRAVDKPIEAVGASKKFVKAAERSIEKTAFQEIHTSVEAKPAPPEAKSKEEKKSAFDSKPKPSEEINPAEELEEARPVPEPKAPAEPTPATAPSTAPLAEIGEPIKAALDRAKVAYTAELGKLREGLLTTLEKEEDHARKAGNTSRVKQLKADRQKFETSGELPATVKTREYETKLAAATATVIKAYTAATAEFTKRRMDADAEKAETELKRLKLSVALIGDWQWGPDYKTRFRPDGTFQHWHKSGALNSTGKWITEPNGTIKMSHDNGFTAVITMSRSAGAGSVVATSPQGNQHTVAIAKLPIGRR